MRKRILEFGQKLSPKFHCIKKFTNPVVVAAAVAASPAAGALMAAAARKEILPASPAQSHSWQSQATAAAAQPGCAAPSRWAALAAPAQLLEVVALIPAPAHAPRPAPGLVEAQSVVPSLAAGLQSDDTSRNCNCGICSTACGPLTLS